MSFNPILVMLLRCHLGIERRTGLSKPSPHSSQSLSAQCRKFAKSEPASRVPPSMYLSLGLPQLSVTSLVSYPPNQPSNSRASASTQALGIGASDPRTFQENNSWPDSTVFAPPARGAASSWVLHQPISASASSRRLVLPFGERAGRTLILQPGDCRSTSARTLACPRTGWHSELAGR